MVWVLDSMDQASDNRENVDCNYSFEDSGEETILYKISDHQLTATDAHSILRTVDPSKLTKRAPFKPNGGEIYVYEADMAAHHVADGYRWQCSTGFQPLPTRQNVLVHRKAKKIITPSSGKTGDGRFMIHLFRLPQQPSPLLVHYIGDSTIYQPLPHKAAIKFNNREFFRTAPTIAEKAKSNLDMHPQQVYEEALCEPKTFQPAYEPRDRKQIENFQHAERASNRLSQDPLYNLYALGFEYADFVKEYRVNFAADNNVVYLANPPLLEKLTTLFDPPRGAPYETVQIFYDTTFQLGQFFVSIFCFRHSALIGHPTLPAAFMLHQRKFSADHNAFLNSLVKYCPRLGTERFAFITDREFRDVSSIFPKAQHLYCWTHIRRDVRQWSHQSHHLGTDFQRKENDNGTYSDDIKQLMNTENLENFEATLLQLRRDHWAPGFVKYFDEHLRNDLLTKACRWIVEATGLYNSCTGITTNAIESVNAVISRSFTKPAKIDEAVLLLYHLTAYYNYEVNRGLCNVGKYQLRSDFAEWKDEIALVRRDDIFPPHMIVKQVKEKLSKMEAVRPQAPSITQVQSIKSDISLDDSTKAAQIHLAASTEIVTKHDPLTEKTSRLPCTSQIDCAKVLCQNQKVTLVSERGVFVVEGGRGRNYCVTLFPKETCQCPATVTCYHILAARLSIGLNESTIIGRKNLTKLFRKNRKFADRHIGGKKPKKKDLDPVENAQNEPDSNIQSQVVSEIGSKRIVVDDNFTRKRVKVSSVGADLTDQRTLWSKLTSPLRSFPQNNQFGVYASARNETGINSHRSVLNDSTNSNSLYCVCRQKYDNDDLRQMAQCFRCENWFHETCLNIPANALEEEEYYWECDDCWKKGAVVIGGSVLNSESNLQETFTNTCPLDSVFTIIHSYEKREQNVLAYETENDALIVLKETMGLFRRQDYNAGKYHWINYVLKIAPDLVKIIRQSNGTTYDVFGDPRDLVFNFLSDAWTLDIKRICSNRSCSTKNSTSRRAYFVLSPTEDIKRDGSFDLCKCLCRIVSSLDSPCSAVVEDGHSACTGIRKSGAGRFESKSPFMIPFDMTLVPNLSEYSKLPLQFVYDRQRFSLGGLILHQKVPRHFEVLLRRDNDWFYGNGYSELRIVDNDTICRLGSGRTISTAIYFLQRK